MLCACMMILMQSLDARHAPKKYPAGVSCRAKKLTALSESLVIGSLTSFVSNTILCVFEVHLREAQSLSSSHWVSASRLDIFSFSSRSDKSEEIVCFVQAAVEGIFRLSDFEN